MTDNKTNKTSSWKNWIIKKLLSSESTKEEILNFIASETEEKKHLDEILKRIAPYVDNTTKEKINTRNKRKNSTISTY